MPVARAITRSGSNRSVGNVLSFTPRSRRRAFRSTRTDDPACVRAPDRRPGPRGPARGVPAGAREGLTVAGRGAARDRDPRRPRDNKAALRAELPRWQAARDQARVGPHVLASTREDQAERTVSIRDVMRLA